MRLQAAVLCTCTCGYRLPGCEIAMASRLLMTGHAAATLASSDRSKPRTSGALTTAHAEKCERDSASLCSGIRPTCGQRAVR